MRLLVHLLFCFVGFISFQEVRSQTPIWQWAKSHGASKFEVANGITSDGSGNIYMCGFSLDTTIAFDSEILNSVSGTSFLVKYDGNGNVKWARSAPGAIMTAVATDFSSNIYITGSFYDTAIFGSDTLINSFPGSGASDLFLSKYDSSGNVIWARKALGSNPEADGGTSLILDNFGNVYVVGTFSSNIIYFDAISLQNGCPGCVPAEGDMFLAKYDTSGNAIWARNAVCMDNDEAHSVTVDDEGNPYVGGHFEDFSIDFDTITLNAANVSWAMFFVKYDTAGKVLWAKTAGGNPYAGSTVHAVAADSFKHVYIGGSFSSPAMTLGSYTLSGTTGDVFVAKYDADGNVIWLKGAGGSKVDEGISLATDLHGDVYFSGHFRSPSVTFGSNTLINPNGSNDSTDIFVFKYDSTGNELWAKGAPGNGHDRTTAICVDSSGSAYLAGWYTSYSLSFDATTFTGTNYNYADIFVAKLDNVVGQEDIQSENDIFVYPNPVKDILHINFLRSIQAVEISDLLGRSVIEAKPNDLNNITLDVSSLPAGVYFVKVIAGDSNKLIKVVKQ